MDPLDSGDFFLIGRDEYSPDKPCSRSKSVEKVHEVFLSTPTALESKNPLLDSIIVINRNNLGDPTSQRCLWVENEGDWYFQPMSRPTMEDPDMNLEGCPSQQHSREKYIAGLDQFRGDKEILRTEYLNDLLSDINLNVPGSTKIHIENAKEEVILQQVQDDISRFSSLKINGLIIYDKNDEKQCSSVPHLSVYQILLSALKVQAKATHNFSKLLTQASLARPLEILLHKFANGDLEMILSNALRSDAFVDTKVKIAKERWCEVRIEAVFGIMDISMQAEEKMPPTIRFIKVIRKILIEKKGLKEGRSKKGMIEDVYSPFFEDMNSALKFKLVEAKGRVQAINSPCALL